MAADRRPHIGEYDTKTNGVCGFSQIHAPNWADNGPPGGD